MNKRLFYRYLALAGLIALFTIAFHAPQATAAQNKETAVFAASVMTEAFTEIKEKFQKANPGSKVNIQFAATSVLRTQVEQGATPDIFESADLKSITMLKKGGFLATPYRPIAHNSLVVIVPKANPAKIGSLADLTKPGTTLVACSPEVPIGAYTVQVLDNLQKSGKYGTDYKERVRANFRSLEPNVKGLVAKVMLGDADAAFCYASDVSKEVRQKVTVIDIPKQYNVLASHYIAIVKGCSNTAMGKKFIHFVLSNQGQSILKRHGLVPIKAVKG